MDLHDKYLEQIKQQDDQINRLKMDNKSLNERVNGLMNFALGPFMLFTRLQSVPMINCLLGFFVELFASLTRTVQYIWSWIRFILSWIHYIVLLPFTIWSRIWNFWMNLCCRCLQWLMKCFGIKRKQT